MAELLRGLGLSYTILIKEQCINLQKQRGAL